MRNFNRIRKMQIGGDFSLDPEILFYIQQENLKQKRELEQNGLRSYEDIIKADNAKLDTEIGEMAKGNNNMEGSNNANSSKSGSYTQILNALGGVASVGSNVINQDMYYTDGWNKAGQVVNSLSGIPILGPASQVAKFGVNSIVKGLGTEMGNFDFDKGIAERQGGSYSGWLANANRAKSMSGKTALGKAFREGSNTINNAQIQTKTIEAIDKNAQNAYARAANTQLNHMQYETTLNGGFDPRYMAIAKLGIKLENLNRLQTYKTKQIINVNTKQIEEFKNGGSIGEEFIPTIIEEPWIPEIVLDAFKDGGKTDKKSKNRTIEELIEYPKEYLQFKASLPDNQKNTPESEYDTYLGWQLYGKPKDFETAKELGMYTWDNSDNSWHGNTVAWDETTGVGHFLKPKHHSTLGYELDWFNKGIVTEEGGKQREMTSEERKEWEDFRSKYTLVDDGNFYKYVPKNKEGGSIKESEELVKLEETNQKNVIPEGALHKNKHHIENTKGLTQKGIPVIDNEGEQQAEIELDEIIFTLEVTKKLEELHKLYKEGSNKERDEAAIEAGKLLVQEILYNTDDRTGLIAKCEKGGKL